MGRNSDASLGAAGFSPRGAREGAVWTLRICTRIPRGLKPAALMGAMDHLVKDWE